MDPIMLKTGHETPFPFHPIPSHPDSIRVNVKRPTVPRCDNMCQVYFPSAIAPICNQINGTQDLVTFKTTELTGFFSGRKKKPSESFDPHKSQYDSRLLKLKKK